MKSITNFSALLQTWPPASVRELIASCTADDAVRALNASGKFTPHNLAALVSPAAEPLLENLARCSASWTRQRFGRAVQFFVPLYVSNYCCNGCRYCGFNQATSNSVRRALTLDEAVSEAECLSAQGFAHILLVSGEDRKNTPPQYFADLARRIRHRFASIQVEIYSLSSAEYKLLAASGVDGVTMFQETYNPAVYADYHMSGPKRDYDNRIDSIERAAQSGMTFLGLGSLLGINDWREETFYLGLHADYLQRRYWRSAVSISFPRMRPAHGGDPAAYPVSDSALVQLMCALRVQLPDVIMTLSTRESPGFREQLVKLAVTKMSAGAKTTPGGYTDATSAEAQFEVADKRPLREVSDSIAAAGFDPVMKDWDREYDLG
ncbi:MAG: 2-iminoacetate synthase ThiH [Kiritimatiellae bacterium]|nr:2-iminoacetate synthase ThiH [Kiritimatiellia bacterium]